MKKIGILGSTGSIGTQALDIVRANSKELKVVALAAGSNIDLMETQIREFKPEVAVMGSDKAAFELRNRVSDLPGLKVLSGMEGMLEMAVLPSMEMFLTAIVGMIGIRPTIAAIEAGKTIALANKETLVCAGHIIMPLAREKGVKILPVDSEHSAIFQSIGSEPNEKIEKILLTASGGPFRGMKMEELKDKTVADALKHPNWSMGQKITIDSASLVNKALEVMEARWLFDVTLDQIEVIIHPQSIIHSAVQFIDGGIIAQMGVPDMKLPIQYALFYPERKPMEGNRVDFFKLGQITFEKPDTEAFRGLALGLEAAKTGGSMPTVFNAANERANAMFLHKQIKFLQIGEIIEQCMREHTVIDNPTVEDILRVEKEVYEYIDSSIEV
ncbi:MAG: 1-deoxy-D-xylulose-5-phosphate reductoisomerase [Lachnospiraceae bacterium]|nr:1-deoxy-D-xylulose-5-phosphate reductoisomerase [Lachnospiraceae bacterium]